MGSVSLYSSSTSLSNALQYSTQTTQQTERTTEAAANSAQDTVKISDSAQAKLLHRQGESVKSIAAALGTTTKTVDNYLGITEEKELEQTLEATLSATG
jgi:DNA-binding NarL/FixJ family response regulator